MTRTDAMDASRDASSTPRLLTGHLNQWAAAAPAETAFTYLDYGSDRNGVPYSLTTADLRRRALAVAARLASVAGSGERAAILAPQGLDFVVGFLGCLYAGVIAVPLSTPDLPGHSDRLAAVLADCRPSCVLTTVSAVADVRRYLDERQVGANRLLAVDAVPQDAGEGWLPPVLTAEDIAYLQYTSGSTRTPAGVMITHANLVANARQALAAYTSPGTPSTVVGWLPLFHDMGLLLAVAAPIVGRLPAVLMDPAAFLRQPMRWLRLLSQYPGGLSAAPNFAYDFCVSRMREDDLRTLDLRQVKTLVNGAEPVRPATVNRFYEVFGACGLRPEAHRPSYGLAEATVFVSASAVERPPTVVEVDGDALTRGVAAAGEPGAPGTRRLVGCGAPVGQQVRIVDPESGVERPDGQIGEIWVHGPNVGLGYWGRAEQSAETFAARLAAPGAGVPAGPWLRTGDLGVRYSGELFVTGRMKDLVIVDGRNHYPQDIEETVQAAHAAIRRDHVAAFAVAATAAGGAGDSGCVAAGVGGEDAGECVIVVAEYARQVDVADRDPEVVAREVRAAVSAHHGLRLRDFLLVRPGTIPRTSSGKVARSACRERYLAGSLADPAAGEHVA